MSRNRDLERLTAIEQRKATHLWIERQISHALGGWCSPPSIRGHRRFRYGRGGGPTEESLAASYGREVRLMRADGTEGFLWGRETWCRRRNCASGLLVAWTEDRAGRIVRGWFRQGSQQELNAYDAPPRSCPIEAAWLASVQAGRPSFPALPYLRCMDGDQDAAAVVKRLQAIGREIRVQEVQP